MTIRRSLREASASSMRKLSGVRLSASRRTLPSKSGSVSRCSRSEAVKTGSQDSSSPSELDRLRGEIEPWYEQEEDVLTYALFENTAKEFFEYRKARRYALDGSHADSALGVHSV